MEGEWMGGWMDGKLSLLWLHNFSGGEFFTLTPSKLNFILTWFGVEWGEINYKKFIYNTIT